MRQGTFHVILVWFSFALGLQAQPTPAPADSFDKPVALVPRERFNGTVTVKDRAGRTRVLEIQMRDWTIPNRQRVERFPQDGTIIVQLRAGDLVTVMNGQRQARTPDDFWTVPAGTAMTIETGQDTVALQTVATRESSATPPR